MGGYLKKMNTVFVVDKETGEQLEENTSYYLVDNDKNYFFVYSRILNIIPKMGIGEIRTMMWMVGNMAYNDNEMIMTIARKKRAALDMDVSVSCINNSLPMLVKSGLLLKGSSKRDAAYYVNPEYLWRGDSKKRRFELKSLFEKRVPKGQPIEVEKKYEENNEPPTVTNDPSETYLPDAVLTPVVLDYSDVKEELESKEEWAERMNKLMNNE